MSPSGTPRAVSKTAHAAAVSALKAVITADKNTFKSSRGVVFKRVKGGVKRQMTSTEKAAAIARLQKQGERLRLAQRATKTMLSQNKQAVKIINLATVKKAKKTTTTTKKKAGTKKKNTGTKKKVGTKTTTTPRPKMKRKTSTKAKVTNKAKKQAALKKALKKKAKVTK